MANDALIIFVRNPVLGRVKTRLAATVGDRAALTVYLALCERLREVTDQLSCTRFLYYSEKPDLSDAWSGELYARRVQRDGNLGMRMASAVAQVLSEGYGKVLLIGSDIYGLSTEIIGSAFEALDRKDVVIGPARDGGYYAIGMKNFTPLPFSLEEWSHDRVLDQTTALLRRAGISYELTAPLKDIDTRADLDGTDLDKLL